MTSLLMRLNICAGNWSLDPLTSPGLSLFARLEYLDSVEFPYHLGRVLGRVDFSQVPTDSEP